MEQINWYEIIYWADTILFFCFMIFVGYLFIFAVASLKIERTKYPQTQKQYRYVILFPVKQSDDIILDSVKSFLEQNYRKENFDIVVIFSSLQTSIIQALRELPVILLENPYAGESRARLLEYATKQLNTSTYDVAVIMKPNNTVDETFLEEINKAYHSGGMVIQTHRVSKKIKTNTAILNAVSEEINNSIFRRGHVRLGFSAGLIGSGMAFNYQWLKDNISKVKHGGLTKQLEAIILKQGVFIEYIEYVYTYDEKAKNVSALNNQRRDWYAAERYSLKKALKDFPKALFAGNFDYCDKIFQWMMPSKVLLLVFIVLGAILIPLVDLTLSFKWWVLLFAIIFSFSISIPDKFVNFRTLWAMIAFPLLSISIFRNLFRTNKHD